LRYRCLTWTRTFQPRWRMSGIPPIARRRSNGTNGSKAVKLRGANRFRSSRNSRHCVDVRQRQNGPCSVPFRAAIEAPIEHRSRQGGVTIACRRARQSNRRGSEETVALRLLTFGPLDSIRSRSLETHYAGTQHREGESNRENWNPKRCRRLSCEALALWATFNTRSRAFRG
jgi:hypothetical protein